MKPFLLILFTAILTLLSCYATMAQPLRNEGIKDHHLGNKEIFKPGEVIERGDSLIVVMEKDLSDDFKVIDEQLRELDDPNYIAKQRLILLKQRNALQYGYIYGKVPVSKRANKNFYESGNLMIGKNNKKPLK